MRGFRHLGESLLTAAMIRASAAGLFAAQLAHNSGWPDAIFALRSHTLGMLVIASRSVLIQPATFVPIARIADVLIRPDSLWTTLANALTFRIRQLSRGEWRSSG